MLNINEMCIEVHEILHKKNKNLLTLKSYVFKALGVYGDVTIQVHFRSTYMYMLNLNKYSQSAH